jgi:uncharacterized protein YecE (DUF72 family)
MAIFMARQVGRASHCVEEFSVDTLSLPGFEAPVSAAAVLPASRDVRHEALAARIPSTIRMGTSSWSFPGWAGLVWAEQYSENRLAQHGLAAYANHPLLRAVGVDRTYYRPMDEVALRAFREAVSSDFRFVVKAHEWVTMAQLPRHARYGAHAGRPSPHFLDPEYTTREIVAPLVAALGETLGAVLFQFPPQDSRTWGGSETCGRDAIAERLGRFFDALPSDVPYSVEIRTAQWLTPEYVDALYQSGVSHCLSVHPRMPTLQAQAALAAKTFSRGIVCRWNLSGDQAYEAARTRYSPFNALVDEDPATRNWIARMALRGGELGYPVHVIVNNKAEGSAPLSIIEVAEHISSR